MASYFIGVDVGTGSARAGVFDLNGRMVGQASRAIDLYRPKADFVEQSSDNIWQAVCNAVRDAVNQADINPIQVKGLGFDATCSLVVLDKEGKPLTVSPSGRTEQNIIVWMDHRAIAQAERINATKHRVLDFVGGIISPEMQTPKLLWLKQHMPTTWANAGYLFDLPDFLTWRATQDATRSLCSTVCKWTYLGHEQRWDKSYFQQIGLEDVLEHDAAKIGSDVKMMGEPLGHGLTQRAASEMGLIAGTAVSVSIIDAHAGTLGTLGATGVSGEVADFNRRVALIGGTSTGHMAMSRTARFIGGVWGPYYSAILPEYWLNEGGQSATGALIDHVIQSHPCYPELLAQAKTQGQTIYEVLNAILRRMAGEPENIAFLTQDIHMLPYFHGNRSPRANPTLTGILTGLKLSRTPEDMALHYLATIQAIALGTRHIIETMNHSGYSIDTIMASGGGTKNPIRAGARQRHRLRHAAAGGERSDAAGRRNDGHRGGGRVRHPAGGDERHEPHRQDGHAADQPDKKLLRPQIPGIPRVVQRPHEIPPVDAGGGVMQQEWRQAVQGWQTYSQELAQLGERLDARTWQRLLALLADCRGKIAVTGVGTSGIAARKIAHMLACVERPAVYLDATGAAHGDLGFLRADDLLILISRGGNSDELTRLLPTLQAKGVTLIAVTENPHSAIAQAAQLTIATGVQKEIDPLNMLATTSIVLVLAIFDAACACLMARSGYDKDTLLAVHPGGGVGKSLREEN